jgi:hypothetical protein
MDFLWLVSVQMVRPWRMSHRRTVVSWEPEMTCRTC